MTTLAEIRYVHAVNLNTYEAVRLVYGLGSGGQLLCEKPHTSIPGAVCVFRRALEGSRVTPCDLEPNLVQLAAALKHLNPGLRLRSAVGFAHWILGACEREQTVIAWHGVELALTHTDRESTS